MPPAESIEAESETRQSPDSVVVTVKDPEKHAESDKSTTTDVQNAHDDDEIDEDGGVWGWLAVFGGWLIQFSGFGYSNAFGVYQDYYVRVYLTNCSSSQISWIGSTQLFLQLSIGIVAGRLYDRGYFYSIIIAGSVLSVFSIFMLSLAQPGSYYQIFLAQALGVGLGSGLANVPSLAVLAAHFRTPARRARAMAVVASGSSAGGTLHPIMLNALLNGSGSGSVSGDGGIGFGGAVRASAALVAGCLVLACAVVRKRKSRARARTREDGTDEAKTAREQALALTQTQTQTQMPLGQAVMKFARDPPYVLMMAAMFFFSQGFFFPVFYLQLDAIVHNVNPTFAFYSLTILNSFSILGRLAPGFLSARLGLMNMLTGAAFACAAVVFGMLGLHNGDVAGVAAVGALFGLFSGSYATLLAPTLAALADGPEEMGARIGFGFAFHGLGSLIGTPITGALLTLRYFWWRAIVYAGVMCLSAAATYVLCRAQYKKKRGITGWVV